MSSFEEAGLIQRLLLLSGDVELNPGPVTVGPLKPGDVSTVQNELLGVATKWKELGVHLGLNTSWLDELQKQGQDPQTYLHDVIKEWLARVDVIPMWYTITKALESVGEQDLASKLNDKFCNKNGPLSEEQVHNMLRMQRPYIQGCGFKDCNCATLINATQSLERGGLPYLNPESHPTDSEAYKEKLLLEHKEIVYAFQGLVSTTLKSLTRTSVTLTKLVDYLESLIGTSSNERPSVSLFFQILTNLRNDKTIDEVFIDCHDYYSYYNYMLIKGILLSLCATIENKRVLNNYEEKFSYFSRRTVVEVPPIFMSPSPHGHACISVKVNRDPRQTTIIDVELFRQQLADLLKLRVYALRLIYITVEEEMMVQLYQFPQCLRPGLFPLTDQQETQLKKGKVLTLKCCDYEFNVENVDSDVVEEVMKDLPEENSQPTNEMEATTEDDVTPPSSTRLISNEAILDNLFTSLAETDFKMSLQQDTITQSQLTLARPGMEGKNYVSIVSKFQDKMAVFWLIIGQHISHKLASKQHHKVVIIASTKPRSEELCKDLSKLFPKAKVELFTGAEENNITTKLCDFQPTIIVCTAGKLYYELHSQVVDLSIISLLIIDDFHTVLMNTPLRDVMQDYLHRKIYLDLKWPHMVGITSFPEEGFVAMTIDEMQDRLLNMCAIISKDNDSMSIPVASYPARDSPKETHFSSTTFKFRDSKRDFTAHLAVEMGVLEEQCGVTCPFEKWSPAYLSCVQSHRDTLLTLSTTDTSHLSTVSYLDLLLCCAKAMNVCREFGCEDAVQVLRRHNITESSSQSCDSSFKEVEDVLVMLQAELQKIVTRKNPIVEAVAEKLTSQFSQSPFSKGIIFVDTLKEGQFLCEEIKKILYHVRPNVIDHVYMIGEAMETDSNQLLPSNELAILKNFTRGESRLLIIPFPIETDKEQLQLPSCTFILRLRQATNTTSMMETEYLLTLFASSTTKSCSKLLDDLQLVLMEEVLKDCPFERQTEKMVSNRQENILQEYLAQTRTSYVKSSRKKKTAKPLPEKYTLKCKKCKMFACKAKDIYTLFADGGQFYVIPNRDFRFRFTTKVYKSKHKTIKRISRRHRMLCSNCDSPWGTICYFPARRCVLPVIKSKHFEFEGDQKLHLVKVWSYAPFYVPPITACTFFRCRDTSPPSESE